MKHNFESALEPIGIDAKTGIIRGAVACQAGIEARGHALRTDRVLLRQLLASAKAKGDKVPVHLDHRSGAAGCLGTARNFRLDGDKLRCDVHLFKSHDKFASTMELLQNLHETAGLSASFVGDSDQGMARCKDLLAVDIVIHPAAVATGLFSALDENSDHPETTNAEDDMTDEIKTDEMSEEELATLIHDLLNRIDQLESDNEDLRQQLEDSDDDEVRDDDDEQEEECPIEERGVRGGPHQYSAVLDFRTFDFETLVEQNQRNGMDAKKAHVEALKTFARQKYQTLNL